MDRVVVYHPWDAGIARSESMPREVGVGADTFTFKSWRPTAAWWLRPDGPFKDLEIGLSDIESGRLDTTGYTWLLCAILQYRTADGGSDEVWLCGSRVRIRKLHDAIAARLAARR
jgi:hypothetical protein